MKFFPLLKLWKLSIKLKLEKIDVYFIRIKSIRKDTYAEYNIQAEVELEFSISSCLREDMIRIAIIFRSFYAKYGWENQYKMDEILAIPFVQQVRSFGENIWYPCCLLYSSRKSSRIFDIFR